MWHVQIKFITFKVTVAEFQPSNGIGSILCIFINIKLEFRIRCGVHCPNLRWWNNYQRFNTIPIDFTSTRLLYQRHILGWPYTKMPRTIHFVLNIQKEEKLCTTQKKKIIFSFLQKKKMKITRKKNSRVVMFHIE